MEIQRALDELKTLKIDYDLELGIDFEKAQAEIDQAFKLQQTGVNGSNLQQYLVSYKKRIEAPHALLNDEIITVSKVVEVSNAIEINDLFKNIVDIKRIF